MINNLYVDAPRLGLIVIKGEGIIIVDFNSVYQDSKGNRGGIYNFDSDQKIYIYNGMFKNITSRDFGLIYGLN